MCELPSSQEAQGVVGELGMIRIYRGNENGPHLEAANKGYKRLSLNEAEIISVVVESRRKHR